MKIALLGPTLTSACRDVLGLALRGAPPGTAQTPLAPLAAQLRMLGHNPHIITTDPTVDATVVVEEDGFTITYCPLRGPPRHRARVRALTFFEAEIRSVTQAIHDCQPDIAHAHWTYEFAEAAVRSGYPHLVTMHDLAWQCLFQFRDPYRVARLVMKIRTMRKVRALSVVSPHMVRRAWQYGYLGEIETIPNGVDIPLRLEPRPRDTLRRPVFVTIGNATRLKNVSASVKALRLIRQTLPQAQLHVFGPGLDTNFAAGEAGLIAHGETPHREVMDFLAREATILIHPSRTESFGVVLAEAKARGIPVIAGVAAGGPTYVCDDGASALVDITDPSAIARAALLLLHDHEGFDRARHVSHADALRRFSIEAVVTQYLSAYERVLARTDCPRARGNFTIDASSKLPYAC